MILWRSLLALGVGLLVWRSLAVNLSAHYAERLDKGDADRVAQAAAWAASEPKAALMRAVALLEENPGEARSRLLEAYWRDPSNPKPLLILADLAREEGEYERADALLGQAIRLDPSSPSTLLRAAAHSVERDELEKAVGYWSSALEADPALAARVFPVLLHLVEDPNTQAVVRPLAESPPPWWDGFFAEVAGRALDGETVRALYALRRASATPLSEDERQAYVARLQRDGRITEAYLVWVNGLTREERRHLGLLFDGGFELEPSQGGFGWRAPRTRRVELRNAATFGIEGSSALYLRFASRDTRFRHLYQRLYLDPGNYRVSGQVRPDGLETLGGLRWQINCLLPEREVLAESERFLGASDWRRFTFEFAVPEGCPFQEMRLVSSGRRAFEHRLGGEIWFDAMAIRKIAELSVAARTQFSLDDDAAAGHATKGGESPQDEGQALYGSDGAPPRDGDAGGGSVGPDGEPRAPGSAQSPAEGGRPDQAKAVGGVARPEEAPILDPSD